MSKLPALFTISGCFLHLPLAGKWALSSVFRSGPLTPQVVNNVHDSQCARIDRFDRMKHAQKKNKIIYLCTASSPRQVLDQNTSDFMSGYYLAKWMDGQGDSTKCRP